jgi:hypothetical protein
MNKNYWKNKNINTLTEEDLEKLKIFIEEWSRVSQVMSEGQLNEFEFLDKAKKYLSDLFGISDNNLLTKLIDKITGKSSSGETSIDKINLAKKVPQKDNDFYVKVLKGIDAPVTEENLKFLYAWRKAEGGKAANNPFNTTMNLNSDDRKSNYNTAKVKNYSKPEYGVEATIKTLKNGRYGCIVNGLKNNIGAEEISKCQDLYTWGTRDLVKKVVTASPSGVTPPEIPNYVTQVA